MIVAAPPICKVTDYAERVLSGAIVAGELVRLAAQRHIDDLANGAERGLRWNQGEADAIIEFYRHLSQFKGRWSGEPLELLPWQEFAVGSAFGWQVWDDTLGKWVRRFREVYISVARKNGKALALDTPIPTPDGWTTMGALRAGDTVFDEQGQPCGVTFATEVMLGRPCYRVMFSDGSTIVADADHEWLTTARIDRRGRGGRGRKMNSLRRLRTTAEVAETLHSSLRGDRNHSIPVTAPLECEPRELLVSPYLLGAWLGDGDTAAAILTSVDAEVTQAIEREGTVVRQHASSPLRWGLGNGSRVQAARNVSVQARLRELGVLNNKHIPVAYQRASIHQRMSLLRGLMDTDGYASKAGQCEFTTTKERLATDVCELINGLGFKALLTVGRATLYGRDVGPKFRIQFWAYQDRSPFGMLRKRLRLKAAPAHPARSSTRQIISCEPTKSVPVKCIQVDSPSHLYLAGHSMIPTHNSTVAAGVGLWLLDFDGEPGAEVYAIASKRDQAKQVWDAAQHIVAQSASLSRRIEHLRSTSRLTVHETGSFFIPLGRDSDSEHGLNPSGAIIDELHVHRNRDMVDAIETAVGARTQPLIFYITTAGIEGESIYTETDDRARRVVKGVAPDDRMFVYIATPDDDDDWTDIATYIKGNPSLGVTVQLTDLLAERDKAMTTPGRQNSFKRLRLNMRTSQETAWLDVNQWDKCIAEHLERTGMRSVGVDLGGTRDLSAAAIVTLDDDGGLDVDIRFWMPSDRVQGAEERDGVPYRAWIEAGHIIETQGDYRDDTAILNDLYDLSSGGEVDFDAWQYGYIATQLVDRGVEVVKVPQTFAELGPATEHFEDALSKKSIAHLGNPVLKWMIANTSAEEHRDGSKKPSKSAAWKHKKHIDGVSAIVTALARLLRMSSGDGGWSFGAV